MGETIRAVRASDGRPRIRYGLALHLGDVMYDNIGGDTRLDFTVIGPAVNLNSRMESMCKKTRSHALAFGRICAPKRRRGGVFEGVRTQGVAEKRPDLWPDGMMPIVSRRPLIVGSDVAGALLGVLAARMLRPEIPAPPAPASESPPG